MTSQEEERTIFVSDGCLFGGWNICRRLTTAVLMTRSTTMQWMVGGIPFNLQISQVFTRVLQYFQCVFTEFASFYKCSLCCTNRFYCFPDGKTTVFRYCCDALLISRERLGLLRLVLSLVFTIDFERF